MKRILLAAALSVTLSTPAVAAIEIDETQGFGPTYGSTVADLTIGKPLQLAGAVFGTALHVVGLPFSMASDSVSETKTVLVDKPWAALKRCTGCSPAYDNYVKSQDKEQQGQVRFVVDKPSEIIINSNDIVIINQ